MALLKWLLPIGKFVGLLLVLPVLLAVVAWFAGMHPYVNRAVLLTEQFMHMRTGALKRLTAIGMISRWLGRWGWIVPLPIIGWWVDCEVAILNAEMPWIWKRLQVCSSATQSRKTTPERLLESAPQLVHSDKALPQDG